MGTSSQTQLGAALALTQFLQEHPGLPTASWSIDSVFPTLHGHLHEGGLDALAVYARVLGGSIRPSHDYEYQGLPVRSHRLHTVWRDVHVEVAVVVSRPVEAVAA